MRPILDNDTLLILASHWPLKTQTLFWLAEISTRAISYLQAYVDCVCSWLFEILQLPFIKLAAFEYFIWIDLDWHLEVFIWSDLVYQHISARHISHFKDLDWVIILFDVLEIKIELKVQIDKSFMHTMIKSRSSAQNISFVGNKKFSI